MCNYKKLIRDINVKLQERKYNFKEFKGVFVKLPRPVIFPTFWNYFSTQKGMDRFTVLWTRSTDGGP
jgi:hypothetical protein